MPLVISLYGAQQWRRSCGGLGVLTPSLSGSGVQMCTGPPLFSAMLLLYTWPVIHSISSVMSTVAELYMHAS